MERLPLLLFSQSTSGVWVRHSVVFTDGSKRAVENAPPLHMTLNSWCGPADDVHGVALRYVWGTLSRGTLLVRGGLHGIGAWSESVHPPPAG